METDHSSRMTCNIGKYAKSESESTTGPLEVLFVLGFFAAAFAVIVAPFVIGFMLTFPA